jgi:predicted HicB family RNase H-like nuclease
MLRVKVPPEWKRWLEEAAAARAMSVAALVRQCIRGLMIARHDEDG